MQEKPAIPQALEPAPPASASLESEPWTPPEPSKPVRRSFLIRVFRRMLRRFGLGKSTPVPRCTGLTRTGQPCRAPAMANGYCRMHGGSRHGKVVQMIHGLRGRVSDPEERAESFGD